MADYKICPACHEYPCSCKHKEIKIQRITKKGKKRTHIQSYSLTDAEWADLLALLKKKLGTGGKMGEQEIQIQGDFRDELADQLTQQGYRVKKVGG